MTVTPTELAEAFQKAGYRAHVEFSGYVSVLINGGSFDFGTANPTWSGNETFEGRISVETGIPVDAVIEPRALVAALVHASRRDLSREDWARAADSYAGAVSDGLRGAVLEAHAAFATALTKRYDLASGDEDPQRAVALDDALRDYARAFIFGNLPRLSAYQP